MSLLLRLRRLIDYVTSCVCCPKCFYYFFRDYCCVSSWRCQSNGIKSRALAVHREIPCYIKDEGRLDAFEIFTDEYITIPKRTTDVKLNIVNECPFIEVNNVELRTLLNSGCFQIGNVDYVFNNSRIMQIRQYITDEPSVQ